ncbi:PREDICTED: transmembrane 42 [Prunus dulcis]|uniref:PREDICTED: transmembrane 42 n=1 Tax=Prunus dulcis TaxID=3755 RepID=A0A5E4F2Z8_PRUDU|nr:PREDICTED: transmembrane 42 [Prunus dulcis]
MEGNNKKGYAWAISAGLNAALAAVSAKLITPQIVRYGLVILFNATMWGCYVNSLKAVSSLQATVTNFAANFLSSGLAGYFLFQEPLSFQFKFCVGIMLCQSSPHHKKKKQNHTYTFAMSHFSFYHTSRRAHEN